MPDREKVIKGLEICKERNYCCPECPYYDRDAEMGCHSNELMADALTLLKEQAEEIENLKQTAQSMMEGICLLKEQEAVVHCGDCENFCFDNINPNAGRCMLTNMSHSKTWFCAHGKSEEGR